MKLRFGVLLAFACQVFCSFGLRAEDATPDPSDSLFDLDRVVEISISLPQDDWDALCAQERVFATNFLKTAPTKPFTYFKADVTIDGVTVKDVGVRKKGFIGSLDHERPSLKIKFNEFGLSTHGLGVSRLTLNNNKQDDSVAGQVVFYELLRSAGLPAPRCNLARVTVNGISLGVYSNVESIKKGFLERQFGDGTGHLYEGTLADFFEDRLDRFDVKKKRQEGDLEPLRRLTQLLAAEGELDLDRLGELIDLDAFLTHWALESVCGFWDGYSNNQNNFFLYQNPSNKKLYWIPWGADSVFMETPWLPFLPRGPKCIRAHSRLAFRLYADKRTRKRYHTTLLRVLDEIWAEDTLLGRMDNIRDLVKGQLHRRQRQYLAKSDTIRSFIEKRRAEIEGELEDWPVTTASEARVPVYSKDVGTGKGTFATHWERPSEEEGSGSGPGGSPLGTKLELVIDGKPLVLADLQAKAEPSNIGDPSGPDGSARPPAVIFTGTPMDHDSKMTIVLRFPRLEFRPGLPEPIRVQGIVSHGFGFANLLFLTGTAHLEKADREEGAPVEGRVEFTAYRLVTR